MLPKNAKRSLKMRLRVKNFQVLSDSDTKFLRVRFLISKYTTCQTFFEKILCKKSVFEQKCALEKHVLIEITPKKGRSLHFLCIFKKHDSDAEIFFKKQVY